MKQTSIHLSIPDKDKDLYFELMRQSSLNYVPISPLCRHYIRKGMEASGKLQLITVK